MDKDDENKYRQRRFMLYKDILNVGFSRTNFSDESDAVINNEMIWQPITGTNSPTHRNASSSHEQPNLCMVGWAAGDGIKIKTNELIAV